MEYSLKQRRQLWLYTFVCPAIDKFARIVKKVAPPEEIFDAPPDALGKYVDENTLAHMRRCNSEEYIDELLRRLERRSICFVCRGDADYPAAFEQTAEFIVPPELIFVRGNPHLNIDNGIAMVGTRSSTREGGQIAHGFAEDFARAGAAVVSGMAVGIDAASCEGALAAGGRVIGVLGCGVDVPYPAQNQPLVRRVIENGGSIISEYMPGMRANAMYFPARNRIIAGMTLATVIVQAPARSGALNTASHALNCGHEIFVVPGSVLDEKFAGSNALLMEGAAPALTALDVLEALGMVGLEDRPPTPPARTPNPAGGPSAARPADALRAAASPALNVDEQCIAELLRTGERSFDEIIAQTNFDAAKLNSLLTMLKIKRIIYETTGKHYRIDDATPR